MRRKGTRGPGGSAIPVGEEVPKHRQVAEDARPSKTAACRSASSLG